MKRLQDKLKNISLRNQLIIFSLIVSLLVGGIAFFVLRFNYQALKNDSDYLEYISKINTLYRLQEENSKLLYSILEEPINDSKTLLSNNILLSYQLLTEIESSSSFVESSLRIKVATYLMKRFEKHVEEMIWLREYEDAKGIDTKSSYYEIYLESSEILTRINSYIQEILRYSVEENQEFIDQSKKDNIKLQILIICFVLLTLFGSIGFYIFFANYMSRLILNISQITKDISNGGNQREIKNLTGPREIQDLTVSFNQLLDTIYSLNLKAEEKNKLELRLAEESLEQLKIQKLLKESQLQGLQLQIKPHFLFNTLNVISMTALLENADTAHRLIVALSKFMRHCLKEAKSKIPLSEELDMVTQYLYILKARMGDHLTYRIECTAKTNLIQIPMLTLQPLVENAFKHGIEDKIEPGMIFIRIKQKDEYLYLSVYDNGKGMLPEHRNQIRELFLPHPIDFSKQAHIGIENVVNRLVMLFENRVSFQIRSSHRKGTVFTIHIKL